MALSTVERAWLEYARDVVCNEEHRLACEAAGGSPPGHPGVDATDVRWPGYLGRSYKPGGLLCVAMVHRDFASAGVGTDIRDRLVDATLQWKVRNIDDEAYLSAVRYAYEAGLRRWTVKGNIEAALRHLNTDTRSICYVNAARCQYPEMEPKEPRGKAKRTKEALVHLCLSTFPIEDLAKRIEASVVLFTNVAAYDRTAPNLPTTTLAVAIHQQLAPGHAPLVRQLSIGGSFFDVETRVASWAGPVRAHLHRSILCAPSNGKTESIVSQVLHPSADASGAPGQSPRSTPASNRSEPVGMAGKTLGWCKYCRRKDAEIYSQRAGVHNAECKQCFAIYSAIKGYPGRTRGSCRDAQRRAIEEIKRPVTLPIEPSPLDALPQEQRLPALRIQRRLEEHPSRRTGSVNKALRLILTTI